LKSEQPVPLIYLIKFHAILERNIFGRQYINIISKLDFLTMKVYGKTIEGKRVYETVCLIKVYRKT
jgi:hypothetical protein